MFQVHFVEYFNNNVKMIIDKHKDEMTLSDLYLSCVFCDETSTTGSTGNTQDVNAVNAPATSETKAKYMV